MLSFLRSLFNTSFFWFSYHILNTTVHMQKIKTTLSSFTAMGTLISFLYSLLFHFDLLLFASLLLSYLWVEHIINLIESEKMLINSSMRS